MEETVDARFASLMDEELNLLIKDYSVPHIAELGQNSVITQSQYAKVIFHDIADTYPTDADICCRYSLTDGITVSRGDRVALYRVGWSSVQEHIVFEWVPVTDATELQVLFKASSLPKDENEFYQLCYVTINDQVCGASVPFQFRHLHESELCAVEEPGGMVVVRSRTAFTEEKLREAFVANELLQKEKGNLEKELQILEKKYHKVSAELLSAMQKLAKLETEKQALEKRIEENLHMERHVEHLKQDLLVSDKEKNQSLAKLDKAERHIQVLTATMDTLSADKEYMAQLLRSETQNKSGVAAEISQFKGQVDSLTHMLEALSQSKELVSQELRMQQAVCSELREDVQRLESASREQQNKIAELQKEKVVLQEQTLCAEKTSEEKVKQINELEKEKKCLLSKLAQDQENFRIHLKKIIDEYEGRLKEVSEQASGVQLDIVRTKKEADERMKEIVEKTQVNKCLTQKLQAAESIISEKEHSVTQITCEKARLEGNLKKAVDAQKKLLEHNERLTTHLMELENESSALRLQLQMSNIQCERKVHFREVFTDLAHRIVDLKMVQEEITSNKDIQLQRIDVITERLSELDVEETKLRCERQEVAAICDTQEDELAQAVGNLKSLEERQKKSYLMEIDSDNSNINTLKEAVDELLSSIASCNMRISEIDLQMKEVEEEKSVLMQQQSHALERKNEYKKREEELRKELIELQECEREVVQEQRGQLATLQDQMDHSQNQNSEVLATGLTLEEKLALAMEEKAKLQQKLEESSSSQEQQSASVNSTEVNTCLEQEQQLQLRLQLAAVEYKKLYTEKQKVERRLAKMYHKLNDKRVKPSPASEQPEASSSEAKDQPATGELISFSQVTVTSSKIDMALPLQKKAGSNLCFVCPICDVTFPTEACDLFTQHFDAHLS